MTHHEEYLANSMQEGVLAPQVPPSVRTLRVVKKGHCFMSTLRIPKRKNNQWYPLLQQSHAAAIMSIHVPCSSGAPLVQQQQQQGKTTARKNKSHNNKTTKTGTRKTSFHNYSVTTTATMTTTVETQAHSSMSNGTTFSRETTHQYHQFPSTTTSTIMATMRKEANVAAQGEREHKEIIGEFYTKQENGTQRKGTGVASGKEEEIITQTTQTIITTRNELNTCERKVIDMGTHVMTRVNYTQCDWLVKAYSCCQDVKWMNEWLRQ